MYEHNRLDIAQIEKWLGMDRIEHQGVMDIAPAVASKTSTSRMIEACADDNWCSFAVAVHSCAPSI